MRLNCPVCDSPRSEIIGWRERVPVLMHSVYATPDEARACPTGTLSMRRCETCGFGWNAAFDPEKIVYGPGYDNAQGFSPHFQKHLDDRIDAILKAAPAARGLRVLEIGAGQGDFLLRLAERAEGKLDWAVGFDPAWKGAEGGVIGPARKVRMWGRIFDEGAAALLQGQAPDLVLSRHVIEHIPNPVGFLSSIRASVPATAETRLCLETPDVAWIVRNHAFEDLFYEHCSVFDPPSMHRALKGAGFSGAEVSTVFGDQYLWAEATFGSAIAAAPQPESASKSPAGSMAPPDRRLAPVRRHHRHLGGRRERNDLRADR